MTKRETRMAVAVAILAELLLAPVPALPQCCGDCNGDGRVTVDEILAAADAALGLQCRAQSGGARFPSTGQTTCSDADGNLIDCGGTGHDGAIRAGATLVYVDNGDGTISDLNTHLMWEKKSADGSIHDWSNVYTWEDAFRTFIAGLNAAGGFAGHTDWRLPNVKELQSIINYQNVAPAVSAPFTTNCAPGCTVETCSCTQSFFYWSSSSIQVSPGGVWLVDFALGTVGNFDETDRNYARAVRGGA